MSNTSRVIIALDFASAEQALQLATRLDPMQCRLKVGKELFTCSGPRLVSKLVEKGFDVFLDLKFHDIPNTVAKACQSAAELGVWMVNVHASGGSKMMVAARESLEKGAHRPKLIAVTVLTSMNASDLHEIGIDLEPMQHVLRLAQLTKNAGLDGVVCSPLEVAALRKTCGDGFSLVTPGVRPVGAALNDQQRIMTPGDAIKAGANYLVIGRPITQAADPLAALATINAEVAAAQ